MFCGPPTAQNAMRRPRGGAIMLLSFLTFLSLFGLVKFAFINLKWRERAGRYNDSRSQYQHTDWYSHHRN